ncbi:MAG TPA: family 20 glycosylhydrolase [Clostridiales bacterium]|nr:family 20 glycosylhydrolase [Clostridiales bacterium]
MSIKNYISPIPQHFESLEGDEVVLGKPGKAMYQIEATSLPDDRLAETAVELLCSYMTGLLNADASDAKGAIPIRLAVGKAPDNVKNPEQGYLLEVTPEAVTITGFGALGLYYGVITLKQCLKLEENILKLPCMRILDWPDLKTRGHFMESRYGSNLMTLDDWKHVVDHMANMKMNQLVVSVYGCWCVQYDGRVSEYLYVPIKKYPELQTPVVARYFSPTYNKWVDNEKLPPMFEQDFFGELIVYGKTRGVAVFPLFNSYGHNTLIPATYPEVSAKDENGEATLTGFCTSNPKTYELMFSIYDEIIDRYLIPNGIDSFHVGLDEVWDGLAHNAQDIYKKRSPWCKCTECRNASRKHLFIDHAIKLLKHLKSRGIKNIYMYHDMLIGHGEADTAESAEDMVKALRDNDLIDNVVIDWWTYSDFQDKLMFQTTRPDLGFRCTVKPWNGYYHWTVLTNPLRNIYLLAKMGTEEGVEGMQSYSAWDESYDRNHICQADYSWNYKGTGSIECMTDRYVKRNFGAQYDKAQRAFELIDLITEVRNEKKEDGTPVLSKYGILLSTMSYYFYSYVREGKPYPRIFPGEALRIINADRKNYLREINEIAVMAKEASALLDEVSADPRCNTKLAKRFGYEVENYRCLAEDYLAIFKMIDIADTCCKCKYEKIKDMALQRKLARLALMTRLEQTKEHFLMASHMRNHSIFMQFFSDLEGYMASTDPSEIKLDFFDMRYLESEAFRKLR